jgi:hypothetical protein
MAAGTAGKGRLAGECVVAMKYIMLIYQGPALEGDAALTDEEQKQVYADYQAIDQTPGVTSVPPMGLPETATTVRVEGGRTLTTDGPFVWSRILAMLIGVLGDFDLAEDAAQEAFAVAATRRRAGKPPRVADDDGTQPHHRPHPPRPGPRRQGRAARSPRRYP